MNYQNCDCFFNNPFAIYVGKFVIFAVAGWRASCADWQFEAVAGSIMRKNAEDDTRLKCWTWQISLSQIIDIKDIPKVDFPKWDHLKDIQNNSKPWFSTKSRLCCVLAFPRAVKNDERWRCAISGRPLQGASPRLGEPIINLNSLFFNILSIDLSLSMTYLCS